MDFSAKTTEFFSSPSSSLFLFFQEEIFGALFSRLPLHLTTMRPPEEEEERNQKKKEKEKRKKK